MVKFYSTQSSKIDNISNIKTRSNFFRNSFFPPTIIGWSKLDRDIHKSDSLNVLQLSLLKFVRPVVNSVFELNNPYGLKLLTRLRLGLSHLRYYKFRHNFQDCINLICVCGLEIDRSSHPEVFLRKGVLKICSKFTGEHPCRSVISIKLLWNFIEAARRHRCSPVNMLRIFRTPFPKNTPGRCFWIEATTHFLLHCPLFQSARQSLLINIKKSDESILKKHNEHITKTLLYGNDKFDLSCNKSSTIEFIVSTGRFSNSLV